MNDLKIFVATPVFGEIFYTPYVQSLLRLQQSLRPQKGSMRHMTVSYASVGDARNALLTHFYDRSDATHILFVDADMGFDPQLVLDMIGLNKPVVGVIATKRQIDLKRLAKLAAGGEKPERAIARAHDFIVRRLRDRTPRRMKGFLEVQACGAGVLLIQRNAVAAMLKALPEISDTSAKKTSPLCADLDRLIRAFDNISVDGVPLMDDFAFCYRWHTICKGEIWASANQAVTHVGLHKFGARYSDATIGVPHIAVAPGKVARTSGNGKTGFAPKVIARPVVFSKVKTGD